MDAANILIIAQKKMDIYKKYNLPTITNKYLISSYKRNDRYYFFSGRFS